jgi:hypothetical protein
MGRTRSSTKFKRLTAKAVLSRKVQRARTCPVCAYPIQVFRHGFGKKGFFRVFDEGCKVVEIVKIQHIQEFNGIPVEVTGTEHGAVLAYAEHRRNEHLNIPRDTMGPEL